MLNPILKISLLLFCIHSINSVATTYNRQIVAAKTIEIDYTSIALLTTANAGTAGTVNVDNAITFLMKYYDEDENAAYSDDLNGTDELFNTSNGGADSTYLFHYERDAAGTYNIGPRSGYSVTAAPGLVRQFAKYYYPQYKNSAVDYPYVVYNLTTSGIVCTNTAGRGPMVTFQAVFYCSDEEAEAAYNTAIATATAAVAWVKQAGTCVANPGAAGFTAAGNLSGAGTMCDILQGTYSVKCD